MFSIINDLMAYIRPGICGVESKAEAMSAFPSLVSDLSVYQTRPV